MINKKISVIKTGLLLFTALALVSTAKASSAPVTDSESRVGIFNRQQHSFTLSESTGLYADGFRLRLDLTVLDEIEETHRYFDTSVIPANELYGGLWPRQHVQAYGNRVQPPTDFVIDMYGFSMPIYTRVTSNFGWRSGRFHYGVDFQARTGDTIFAAFDGKVRVRDFQRGGYGNFLVLRHPNGLETVYAHLSRFLVERDEFVRSGQPIGLAGSTGRSTGPHLHFETRMLGLPINPNRLIDFENQVAHRDEYKITAATFGRTTNNSAVPHTGSQAVALQASVNASVGSTSNAFVAGAVVTHRVVSGDTLGAIARRHGTTAAAIARLNNMNVNATIRVGQTLRVR